MDYSYRVKLYKEKMEKAQRKISLMMVSIYKRVFSGSVHPPIGGTTKVPTPNGQQRSTRRGKTRGQKNTKSLTTRVG